MNRSFGGNQEKLRSTFITKKEGYLGEYHDSNNEQMAQVGRCQHMSFPPSSKARLIDGPFWMEDKEKSERRKDVVTEDISILNKTKEQLLDEITSKNTTFQNKIETV